MAKNKQEDTAELIAGLGLLNYLLIINADLWQMRSVSLRVAHLVQKLVQSSNQPFDLATPCAFVLPPTIAYSCSDYELSKRCTDLIKQNYPNQEGDDEPIELFFANLYAYKFIGNTRKVIALMQPQLFKINDVSINPATRFFIIGFIANLYQMLGIADYYHLLIDEISDRFPELTADSFMALFYKVFEVDLELSECNYNRVLELANDYLQLKSVKENPHVSAHFWHYKAMALVMLGEHIEALESINKALYLRAKVGGSIFILMTHNVLATILSLTGEDKKALRIFACVLKRTISLQDGYQRPMTYAYRANLHLSMGRTNLALADIDSMLTCLKEHQNRFFFYWDNNIMLRLIKFYLSQRNPTQLVKELLYRRFKLDVLPNGSAIPRIQVSLASKKIYIFDKADSFVDLYKFQRAEVKLIELLANRHEHKASIQDCVDYLWDDPSPKKNPRNNLYVLVNKLRSRLSKLVGKEAVKHYLVNKGGYISLDHIDVDLQILKTQAKKAMQLLKQERWWDAEMRFRRMAKTVEEFPKDYSWEQSFRRLLAKAAMTWIGLAEKCQDSQKALYASELGLRFDPVHDGLHRKRYHLFLDLNMPAKAEAAKQEYADALNASGLARHEISKSMV
jgi:hypothetical protein